MTTKKNIAWVSGSYLLSFDILQKIKSKYAHAEMHTFDAESNFSMICSQLLSDSLFDSAKLVVMNGMPSITETEKKQFRTIIENLSENILLVFFLFDANKYKNLYSFAQANCKMYETEAEVSISSVNSYIEKRCKEINIEIKAEDIEYIVQNLQKTNNNKFFNVDTIEILLLKLKLLGDDKKEYGKNDILQVVDNFNNYLVWDLFNACDNKNYAQCLNLFSQCVSLHYDAIQAANEILNIFAWKYRMLLACKEKIAQKLNTQQVCNFVSSIRKVNFVGVGMQAKVNTADNVDDANKSKSSIWSFGLCEQSLNGFYGRKPTIDAYSRKDLFVIVETIQNLYISIRGCKLQSQAYMLIDILFAVICKELHDDVTNKIKTSLLKMSTYEQY